MITRFSTLFTLGVNHAYYGGACADLGFFVPPDCQRVLQGGRLLAKPLNGGLIVLFETDDSGGAMISAEGKTLRIGLQVVNPFFGNITALDPDFFQSGLLYRNSADPGQLAAPLKMRLVGGTFSHTIQDAARPVTVNLKDRAGDVLEAVTITAQENRSHVPVALTKRAQGLYVVEEVSVAFTRQAAYYSDAEILAAGCFGLAEITLAKSFYANAPAFSFVFKAREEVLNYYVLAKKYSDADIGQLLVADAGFNEDLRPEIKFTKISPAGFTAKELPAGLLGGDSTNVVLFQSQGAVARSAKPRKKVQLNKNGTVLVAHLPQPQPQEASANILIPIAKT
jgi:hypothetical protein